MLGNLTKRVVELDEIKFFRIVCVLERASIRNRVQHYGRHIAMLDP